MPFPQARSSLGRVISEPKQAKPVRSTGARASIIENLAKLVKEGNFKHVGLSECNAITLRRANSVHPVATVEIEVSPWSYDDNQKKTIETASELGIAVIAYSEASGKRILYRQDQEPQGLSWHIGTEGDIRAHMTRFSEETMKHNFAIVDDLSAIAKRLGYTPAQLCLAWVAHLGPHVIPLPGSSKATRTLENLEAGDIKLSESEPTEIN